MSTHTGPRLLPEIGAISQWHAELRAGIRTKFTIDALSRAAAYEAAARDAIAAGQVGAANDARRMAAKLILSTVTENAAA